MTSEVTLLLAVDDEADMRLLLDLYLSPAGYSVDTAEDGLEALERLELPPGVDLVLLDLRMPGMDGTDVLRRLRGDDRYRDLPVVVLSAHADDELVDEVMRIGADAFIRKPFTRDELLQALETHLPG